MNQNLNKKILLEKWQLDSNKIISYYQARIKKSGISEKSLDWRDKEGSLKFFNYSIGIIDCAKVFSIFDVGCGTGNFYYFYKDKCNKKVQYTGIDIVPEFINYVKNKNNSLDVKTENFLSFNPKAQYDLVINLGGLNSKTRFFQKYLEYNIFKMYSMSKKYILFNIIVETKDDYFGVNKTRKVGKITSIEEKKLINILGKIKKLGATYNIKKVSIFKGSFDAFVVINK
ncbi:MAG: methyltransferase domain-containing protein [Patescibacteria group bacterium]|jgi:SAM-dependent methyltransferase